MLEGHVLNERYRIEKTIGGGGMANVYLAKDRILDRNVAIKVLRLEFANDPEFIARFDREAQAATSLSHPNIVSIYDVGEEGNILYMVMEYVEGPTLKEYIMENGPLQVDKAIEIMKQLTDAIAHAHANGLVHRDIKPQNILVDEYGNIKVTDFGIAVALSATSLTQTNSILGSVHYLSPEQARGGMATRKSDIYALGIVLYELLTGEVPFSGQSPISIALKHLQNDTPSVRSLRPEVPQSVENIVLQATAKDTFHRYSSVHEMEDALIHALDPAFAHVEKYTPPFEAGEETKAIPVITDDQVQSGSSDETLVHHAGETKVVEEKDPSSPKETEGTKKKKRFRKTKIALLLLAFLLIGVAIFVFLASPKEVEVPDVIGKEANEAEDMLEDLNLKVEKEMTFSEEIEEGHVTKSTPSKGKKVKETSIVKLLISDGKETMEMEDHVGENFLQVKKILEGLGFEEIIAYEKESDQPVGEIITQIQPAPKTDVVPSDTKVIFEISGGPKKISLNNFIGQSLNDVKSYADKHNLKLEVTEDYSDDVEEGKVMNQSPDANSDVTEGDTIKVTVSIGPEELPAKSHTVTFTVPFKPVEDEEGELATSQKVEVFVEDKNTSMDKPLYVEEIEKDEQYTLTLVIDPEEKATYKVLRDGEEFLNKTISYEDGD